MFQKLSPHFIDFITGMLSQSLVYFCRQFRFDLLTLWVNGPRMKALLYLLISYFIIINCKSINEKDEKETKAFGKKGEKAPTRRMPCICEQGSCDCCTGNVLSNFNVTTRNKACVRIAYDPDDFEFHYKLLFNERLLYQSRKNPPPACLPLRRIIPGTICVRFNNVYMVGRNFHGCVNLEAVWQETELFKVAFDCFRIGTSGIAIVKPEEGGGLPIPTHEEQVDPEDLDYNDSA